MRAFCSGLREPALGGGEAPLELLDRRLGDLATPESRFSSPLTWAWVRPVTGATSSRARWRCRRGAVPSARGGSGAGAAASTAARRRRRRREGELEPSRPASSPSSCSSWPTRRQPVAPARRPRSRRRATSARRRRPRRRGLAALRLASRCGAGSGGAARRSGGVKAQPRVVGDEEARPLARHAARPADEAADRLAEEQLGRRGRRVDADAQAGDVDALRDHAHGDEPRLVPRGERGDAGRRVGRRR